MIPTAAPTDKSIRFEITSTQTNQTKFKNYTVPLSLSWASLSLFAAVRDRRLMRVGARQVYSLLVRRGGESHTVVHRYSEFLKLHKSVPSSSSAPNYPARASFLLLT
jgi:hypothetical protein